MRYGQPSIFELGRLDSFNSCPDLRQTQAEMGIKLRLVLSSGSCESKSMTEFRLAWWKYGSQPSQPIRDVNPTVISGGLYRTQPDPVPVYIPTNRKRPTSTLPIPISISQPVRNRPLLARTARPDPTSVPVTPLPTFTITTEQFTATPQRTYSPDSIPTFQPDPTTVPITPLPTFSKPRTSTSYTTNPDPTNDPTNNPTTVPLTSLPTYTSPEPIRSTRKTTTTTSVEPRILKSERFFVKLESPKKTKWCLINCDYLTKYEKIMRNAQGIYC